MGGRNEDKLLSLYISHELMFLSFKSEKHPRVK